MSKQGIFCDESVMNKCIHGSGNGYGSYPTCNYICDTGHKRPCPHEACTEFEPKKKSKRSALSLTN